MKKMLSKRIFIACAIALLFMIAVLYFVQSKVMKDNAVNTAAARISDVTEKLEANDAETQELIDQLNADYIAKADAFAEMIKLDPSIINDADTLNEIMNMLDVEELHVTDDKGIIQWSTVPEYIGFDFASSDQAKEFMPILDDPKIKLAQDAQPNGAEGKYFQYIGVARTDSKGIVQIGNTPERLQKQIENNSIDNVLSSFTVGNTGYVFAVSKADGTVAAHPNKEFIGLAASEIGVSEKILNGSLGTGSTFLKIDGESVLCCAGENDEYTIITAIPQNEVYDGRLLLMTIFIFSTLLMLAIIIVLINSIVQKIIVSGINQILDKMNIISSGDLNVDVDVRTCPEYDTLSSGINSMLANINRNMEETVKLTEEQKHLFGEINSISADIGIQSSEMQDVASRISEGSATQAATVEEISASFSSISKQIQDSAAAAKNASGISNKAATHLNSGAEKLAEMQQAMSRIEESSTKISNIVKTIDDIAFQTNILALNAAVEAARAGQHGKGFAVVADEVRNLANKSAEATKGTASLIEETKRAVEEGTRIADETTESIRSMIHEVTESNKLIDNIAAAADEQAVAFTQIADSMLQISDVVQQNAEISANAEKTAGKLDEQARSLKALFE